MAVNEENLPLEREVRIDAPAEVIFKFFVDPAHMVRWMGVDAELDARPGGLFRVDVTGQDVARGEYLEISPNKRVVFTWGWESEGNPVRPGSSTVEVTLEPDGSATLVRLRHLGLPGGPSDQHADGWDHYLGRLVVAAAAGDAGADPWIRSARDEST